MPTITRPVGGAFPNPIRDEVRLVQQLLNRHRPPPLRPIAEDGLEGPRTTAAIEEFQRRILRMTRPDGRVDPAGATLRALVGEGAAPRGPLPAVATVTVMFQHQGKLPTGVTGLPGAGVTATATRYESSVTVSGGLAGTFKGSIYPDNLNVKGRLLDGSYELYLGFHKPGTPTADDLVARTNGFRAALIVNANRPVPVASNDPAKQTSEAIHVHNGYHSWTAAHPMSEGCLILAPGDWPRFIKLFLDAFPSLADWTVGGGRLGRKIGVVAVRP
jgi:hypothetical protein